MPSKILRGKVTEEQAVKILYERVFDYDIRIESDQSEYRMYRHSQIGTPAAHSIITRLLTNAYGTEYTLTSLYSRRTRCSTWRRCVRCRFSKKKSVEMNMSFGTCCTAYSVGWKAMPTISQPRFNCRPFAYTGGSLVKAHDMCGLFSQRRYEMCLRT